MRDHTGHRRRKRPRWSLAQEAPQVFVFPAACSPISRKVALATIEFFRVNAPAISRERFIRHNGMQHFVIKHVSQKPQRNEWLVQRRINPDHPILFLDCAKNKLFSRSMFSPASPDHFVAAKTLAKVPVV